MWFCYKFLPKLSSPIELNPKTSTSKLLDISFSCRIKQCLILKGLLLEIFNDLPFEEVRGVRFARIPFITLSDLKCARFLTWNVFILTASFLAWKVFIQTASFLAWKVFILTTSFLPWKVFILTARFLTWKVIILTTSFLPWKVFILTASFFTRLV